MAWVVDHFERALLLLWGSYQQPELSVQSISCSWKVQYFSTTQIVIWTKDRECVLYAHWTCSTDEMLYKHVRYHILWLIVTWSHFGTQSLIPRPVWGLRMRSSMRTGNETEKSKLQHFCFIFFLTSLAAVLLWSIFPRKTASSTSSTIQGTWDCCYVRSCLFLHVPEGGSYRGGSPWGNSLTVLAAI